MRQIEPLGWLIVLFYNNRHMRGRYNIHALFHEKKKQ